MVELETRAERYARIGQQLKSEVKDAPAECRSRRYPVKDATVKDDTGPKPNADIVESEKRAGKRPQSDSHPRTRAPSTAGTSSASHLRSPHRESVKTGTMT